jgi:hypothetical protein
VAGFQLATSGSQTFPERRALATRVGGCSQVSGAARSEPLGEEFLNAGAQAVVGH